MSGDPYYHATALLLPMTGANGSATFTDASPNPKTITRYGNTVISTAQSKWGNGSGYFDGTGDGLRVAYESALALSQRNFTLECHVRPEAPTGTIAAILSQDYGSGVTPHILVLQKGASTYGLYYYSAISTEWDVVNGLTIGTNLAYSVWHHVRIICLGKTYLAFLDDVLTHTITTTLNPRVSTAEWTVGTARDYTATPYKGYIQDVRITPGVARPSGNAAPPAAAFPTFQDLTCTPSRLESTLLTCAPGSVAGPPAGLLLAEPMRRYDGEDGGRLYVAGQVTMGGAPVSRKVRLHTLNNSRLIREAWSDPVTGAYRFDDLKDQPYYVWSEDYQRVYDPVSHLVPNLS